MNERPEPQEVVDFRTPRHRWGEGFTRLENTPSGCVETECVCKRCEMVRITVHPPAGFPWHEWKPKNSVRVQLDQTPPCFPGVGT